MLAKGEVRRGPSSERLAFGPRYSEGHRVRTGARRILRADRRQRLGQDDADSHHPRLRRSQQRQRHLRGRRQGDLDRLRAAEILARSLYADAGARPRRARPRWRPAGRAAAFEGAPAQGRRDAGGGGRDAVRRPANRQPVRRRAATGADCARSHQASAPVAPGRTARQSRHAQRGRDRHAATPAVARVPHRGAALGARHESAALDDGPSSSISLMAGR